MYTSLKFGESIEDNWGIINIYDKDSNPTNLIGIRGPMFHESKLDELLKTKKLIGISSYQNFPQPLKNIHDQTNYIHNSNIFLKKYESNIILWCHCFKDPQNYIPPGIPLLLHSDSDHYNGNYLNNLADKVEKKYDFFCNLPNGDWNDWIRSKEVAKKWLNYMADMMDLKILIGGGDKEYGFSEKITFLGHLSWNKFIENMNSSKYCINFARYDASPRVIMEALFLNIPVLLNQDILGGWKYINNSTGKLFFYDESIEECINNFISSKYEPLKWMKLNFNVENNKIILAKNINKLMSYKYEDFLDGIMYINLTDREDRKKSILSELDKAEIPENLIHRIDAVLNKTCGHLGCTDSHIKALEYAKQMKWKCFLILEDDAIFNYPKERILYIISEFYKKYENNWDVFMLSTYWTQMIDTDVEFIKKIVYGTTTTSYIVNEHYIDKLLNNYKESRQLLYDEVEKWKITNPDKKLYETSNAIDQYNNRLQSSDRWYISNPYVCNPTGTLYSSIMS
jgi:GR25 family glycosyltransferase involved in LPS biosynthesis